MIASPLRLKSQPLRIAACPNCGRGANMEWTPNRKWHAWCGDGTGGCGRYFEGYEWADTCLKAFLERQGHAYSRNE